MSLHFHDHQNVGRFHGLASRFIASALRTLGEDKVLVVEAVEPSRLREHTARAEDSRLRAVLLQL